MKVGTRVKYIRIDTEDDKETGYYPPVGTFGTVVEIDGTGICVKWDNGTKDACWWCSFEDVEDMYYDELTDKIASFFEVEENWTALKNCWLENDRSDDLRRLLARAIKE